MTNKAFTLVEVIIAVAILIIIFLGTYAAFQMGSKVVENAKARVLASAIINEKIERVRNLSYEDVGVAGQYPDGVLPGNVTLTREGIDFTLSYEISYQDDSQDGQAGSGDICPNDYKVVQIKAVWSGEASGETLVDTVVAPRNQVQECNEIGGLLEVTVFNASGGAIANPFIKVENINTGLIKPASPDSGIHNFILPEGIDEYKITVAKDGYSTSTTYAIGDVYQGTVIATPQQPHATVLEALLTERSFSIDLLSQFDIQTLEAKIDGNIYYVRKVGSDLSDGLSIDSAFLTLGKASEVMQAGDIVFVGSGVYKETIIPQNSGVSAKDIVYVADKLGVFTGDVGEVVLEAKNGSVFNLTGKRYLEIYGFKITGATSSSAVSIKGAGLSSHIKLADNEITNNAGFGVLIEDASFVELAFNKIHFHPSSGLKIRNSSDVALNKNQFYQNTGSGIEIDNCDDLDVNFNEVFSNSQDGILIFNNSSDCQINNNHIYANTKNGVGIEGGSSLNNAFNNRVYSNQENGFIIDNSLVNTIKTNLIYDNMLSGIHLKAGSSANNLLNNTVFLNQQNGIFLDNSSNSGIVDNILTDNILTGFRVLAASPKKWGFNNIWNNTVDYQGITASSTSISQNPLFVDTDGIDNILGSSGGADDSFHLSQVLAGEAMNSPCLNAGSDFSANLNLDSQTTRTDSANDSGQVDIGFHNSLLEEPVFSGYPEPFGSSIGLAFFDLRGGKIVGKDGSDDDIYKYSFIHQTNSNGQLLLNDLEWDTYSFSDFISSGIGLDLIVSWPSLNPFDLSPDTVKEVKLGLKAEDTLLVQVNDNATADPVFSASVRFYNPSISYDRTLLTDENGECYFIPLEPGSQYNLEVKAAGYQDFNQSSISVSGHDSETVNLTPSG